MIYGSILYFKLIIGLILIRCHFCTYHTEQEISKEKFVPTCFYFWFVFFNYKLLQNETNYSDWYLPLDSFPLDLHQSSLWLYWHAGKICCASYWRVHLWCIKGHRDVQTLSATNKRAFPLLTVESDESYMEDSSAFRCMSKQGGRVTWLLTDTHRVLMGLKQWPFSNGTVSLTTRPPLLSQTQI